MKVTYTLLLLLAANFGFNSCRSSMPTGCIWTALPDSLYANITLVDKTELIDIIAYKKYIDSLSDNDDYQTKVVKELVEGRITQKIETRYFSDFHDDTLNRSKTRKGGFGKYTTTNIKGDTLLRLLYHDNIDKNFYEIYYYKDNKLVYSKIDYQENGIGQSFYFKEVYYKGDSVIRANESPKPINTYYRDRVSFDQYKKGTEYLVEFLTKNH